MAIAVQSVKTSKLRAMDRDLIEITLGDTAAAATTTQTTNVALGKTYRSIKPVAAVGQGTAFMIGVNITSLAEVAVVSKADSAATNYKVFVTLECEV